MLRREIYLGAGYATHPTSQFDELLNYFEQDTSLEVKEPPSYSTNYHYFTKPDNHYPIQNIPHIPIS